MYASLHEEFERRGIASCDWLEVEAFIREEVAKVPVTARSRAKFVLFVICKALAKPVAKAAGLCLAFELAVIGAFELVLNEPPWSMPGGRLYFIMAACVLALPLLAWAVIHGYFQLKPATCLIRFPAYWKEQVVHDFTHPAHIVPGHLRRTFLEALRIDEGVQIFVERLYQRRVSVEIYQTTDYEAQEGTGEIWYAKRGLERIPLGTWDSARANVVKLVPRRTAG